MTVALLVCDHIDPRFAAETGGSYEAMFRALLPGMDLKPYLVCDGYFPASAAAYDAYLVTGSRHSVYDGFPWIERLKAFVREIRQAGKRYVGSCFGHQLLAEALGGRVGKAPGGWAIGVYGFECLAQAPWMQPPREKINLLMMCQDQVLALPPGSKVWAGAPACPVGIFTVGSNMLGLQAHPEYSKAYDRALMQARVDRMGAATVEVGLASLQQPVDREAIAAWISRFLTEGG
jgi:GMP synthase-like glutamine amidotransferase